jgi:translation initiation factor IF-2
MAEQGDFKNSGGRGRKSVSSVQVVIKKRRGARAAATVEDVKVAPTVQKPAELTVHNKNPRNLTAQEAKKRQEVLAASMVENVDDQRKAKKDKIAQAHKEIKEEQAVRTKAPVVEKTIDLNTKSAEPKAKKKLSQITFVSSAKQKLLNNTSEASMFLSKPKYIQQSRRSNKYSESEDGEGQKSRSLASIRRAREKAKRAGHDSNKSQEKTTKEIIIPETISVQELANRMAVRSTDVVKELMKMGMMITASKSIDADTAELVVGEFGHTPKRVSEGDVENILATEVDNDSDLQSRPAVVTVMGHVDHGKTSLLDALRQTDIVAGESGGITQHIGASCIHVNGSIITFLDTPGHAAFTAMRMRGAKTTDIVVLVVAADDGIKEQTIEAINHAKAAEVPIIVAINKIDKEGADPQKVVNELLQHDVITEAVGGDVIVVEVSAKQKLGLDKLEEAILLQAEILDLKANYKRRASGTIIESKIDKSRGIVATFLVQNGTLKVGDIVVAGSAHGKVRVLIDDKGRKAKEAAPSIAVEVFGLDKAPESGSSFDVVENDKTAREIVEYRVKKERDLVAVERNKRKLEDVFSDLGEDKKIRLSLVVKADVKGSVEAVVNGLKALSNDEVDVKIIHSAVGGVTESDIILAKASDAIILAFNVRNDHIRDSYKDEAEIKYYSIIYNLMDDVRAAVVGLLKPIVTETEVGKAEVRQIFNLSKYGKIAGCYVLDGVALRNASCRVIRDAIVIAEDKIKALKHFKDDVKEVTKGMECGISLENFNDMKEGDRLEIFEVSTRAAT